MNTRFELPKKGSERRQSRAAYTLNELLILVIVIGIVGTITLKLIANAGSAAEQTLLASDVRNLNQAVKVFLANGGSLDGVEDTESVLTILKTSTRLQDHDHVVGLRGDMVDPRVVAQDNHHGEYRWRAVWHASSKRFKLVQSRDGWTEFHMDETLASTDFGTSKRETSMKYGTVDGWVWDHEDYAVNQSDAPDNVPDKGVTISDPTGASSGIGLLLPPVISPGSGDYALSKFPLLVSITNPNEEDSAIFYSTSSNSWQPYTSPFEVEPSTLVRAFVASTNPLSNERSPNAWAAFEVIKEQLAIEVIVPRNPISFAEAGGEMEPGSYEPVMPIGPIIVRLTMENRVPLAYRNSDNYQIHWTYDGSDPMTSAQRIDGSEFSGGHPGDSIDYSLPIWGGASLMSLQVIAASNNPTLFHTSHVSSTNLIIQSTQLPAPEIGLPANPRFGDLAELTKLIDSGDVPSGSRIYYTIDGTDPGHDGFGNPATGTLYTGAFDPMLDSEHCANTRTISARLYPPVDYPEWFVVSELATAEFEVSVWSLTADLSGTFSLSAGSGSGLSTNQRAIVYTSATGDGSGTLLGLDNLPALNFAFDLMLGFDLYGDVLGPLGSTPNISSFADLELEASGSLLGGETRLGVDIDLTDTSGDGYTDSLLAKIDFYAELLPNNSNGAINLCYCGMLETDAIGDLGAAGSSLENLVNFAGEPTGLVGTAGTLANTLGVIASNNSSLNVSDWW